MSLNLTHLVHKTESILMNLSKTTWVVGSALLLGLTACGGFVYTTVGGNVTGLVENSKLVLQNEGGFRAELTKDGSFSFQAASNANYEITVFSQPTQVNCTVVNGKGKMTGEASVNNIQVTCVPNVQVGGTLAGLATGKTITLALNDTAQTPLTANGAFTLAPSYAINGKIFTVSVSSQPLAQVCSVVNGDGVADSTKPQLAKLAQVNCVAGVSIGGTVTGLAYNPYDPIATSLVVSNNGNDARTLKADGVFLFDNSALDGAAYNLTVVSNPSGKKCTIANGSGIAKIATSADAVKAVVTCVNG
jgi:hypothetical protein